MVGGGQSQPSPRFKVCGDCLETKLIPDDFYVARRDEAWQPISWQTYCKDCMKKKVRERARKRRRAQGVPARGAYGPRGKKLDPKPFVQWLNEQSNIAAIARSAGIDESRLRRIKNGQMHRQKKLTVEFVDRILVAAGGHTQLWELYGD